MIRSRYLVEQGVDFQKYSDRAPTLQAIGEAVGWPSDGYGCMQLRGPLVARWDDKIQTLVRYVPLPADVVKVGDDYRLLRPLKTPLTRANWPTGGLLPLWVKVTGDNVPKEAQGWLSEEQYAAVQEQGKSDEATKAITLTVSQQDGVKSEASVAEQEEFAPAPAAKPKKAAKAEPVAEEEAAEPTVRKEKPAPQQVPTNDLAALASAWGDDD